MKKQMPFVHLHVHSAYSLLESALPLKKIIDLTISDNQPALAVTDRNNLFGALEYSDLAYKSGLQPIIGCSLDVDLVLSGNKPLRTLRTKNSKEERNGFPNLILLVSNAKGYSNLTRLVSFVHLDNDSSFKPHITLHQLFKYSEGLIVLTGGSHGLVNQLLSKGWIQEARDTLKLLSQVFPNYLYIELQRYLDFNTFIEDQIVEWAYEFDIPLVATNEAYFSKPEDHEAHDVLICIAEGKTLEDDDRRMLSPDHYLKTSSEMRTLFSDLPEALDNTLEIAQRCAFRIPFSDPILPSFTKVKGGRERVFLAESKELEQQAISGLEDRLSKNSIAKGYSYQDYTKRLEFELNVIQKMKYPGYFLIVSDFIKWSKSQGISVGPGRGSGAGSLVAWSLMITDLDPIRFSLIFERFLNPERVSMPDFDIDFCQDRRDEVIRYVQNKYGHKQVAQIITFGTLQARAVLRDVGRVLQVPYGQVNRLCKIISQNSVNPISLAEAIQTESSLIEARNSEPIVDKMISISLKLEGLYRHTSTHPAGIVIGDRNLNTLVPLYRDPRSDMPVTQFNMKWIEKIGLVKFDFLGLKTLTVIRKTQEYLEQRGIYFNINSLLLNDQNTFKMLQKGKTMGVFQLESTGMRKALIGMKPDCFEDIIALVALYRPGPMENIPVYNARKHGKEKAHYYHDKITPILKETYGVIIYQEQVMHIAQVLSGYSLGEADMLRRAMGKKNREEMEIQRKRFIKGAVRGGLKVVQADRLFNVLAKFSGYGFNKSHAAAYALLSYQTAWLKANYPIEFLAALMSLDMKNADKLNDFYQEAKDSNIEFIGPSINRSEVNFSVMDGKIQYALAAVKGVGIQAATHIVDVRKKGGPFINLTNFFSRIDLKILNRKMLKNLIYAGGFDSFSLRREQMIAGLDRLIGYSNRVSDNIAIGIRDLFNEDCLETEVQLPIVNIRSSSEELFHEFQSLGFYLSSHPLDEYASLLKKMRIQNWLDFQLTVKAGGSRGWLAGVLNSRHECKSKMRKRLGIVQLSDPTGQYEAVIFSEGLIQYGHLLEPGNLVILLVDAVNKPEGISLRIQSVELLENKAKTVQNHMRIFIKDERPLTSISKRLEKGGEGTVSLVVMIENGKSSVEIELDGKRIISPQISSTIKTIPGVIHVETI
ncbi:DNA polymerase III subunit alpha [Candidatus Endowatersipora endosymbiont of Watersipora subatra]|uniref:DNA polymerase III subunit alpha n=1 Tax=Candidatus Endowatersipora endosymbiont of Watersipora subatra TaxID=3077946 RepID=UPI00312CAA8B